MTKGVEMQNAKDTFYVTLRDRLAKLNTARTMMLRGVARPSILVEENELPMDGVFTGAFVLRWQELLHLAQVSAELYSMRCEIRYTADDDSGTHRGRILDAMDVELLAILSPGWALKQNFTMPSLVDMKTHVFWNTPVFGAPSVSDGGLERVVKVDVFTYREAGE